MSKIEKIKVEIERLKNELIQEAEKGYKSEFDEGRISAFEDMIVYINSLEEEPISNDLEEAAHSYVDTTIEWFDSEGNPCCYPAFIAGAQWQKKQLIDKACEWLKSYRQDTPDGTGYIPGIINDETIEDFKQAMEE